MKRFKIETDGSYYYPYIRKFLWWWEPIENYEVRNGIIESTGSNKCKTLERARFLIECVREEEESKKKQKIYEQI